MTLLESLFAILSPKTEAGDRAEDGRPQGVHQAMLVMHEKPSPINADTPLFSAVAAAETRRMKAWLADRIGRGRSGIFSEEVALTPVLAELLLGDNPDNRRIRKGRLMEFVTDISNGDWELNGEPIIVADTGELNDGQHRCQAVIMAGKAMHTVITFGVRRSSRLTVDVGAVRTAGDFLAMDGHKNPNVTAAVAGMVWQYEKYGEIKSGQGNRPTKVQVRHTYAEHPGIDDSIDIIPNKARSMARSRSLLAFCHYIIARHAYSRPMADSFILRLCLGDGLTKGDPIYHCREKLIQDKRLHPSERVELIFRTWNASRDNRRATKCSPIMGSLPALSR